MTQTHTANHPEKLARLFAPTTPFVEKLKERLRDHGFEVQHTSAGHHRLELFGPPACGKSRAVRDLADKSRFPAIDIVTHRFDCHPERGNFEVVGFRPHRHPHTDN